MSVDLLYPNKSPWGHYARAKPRRIKLGRPEVSDFWISVHEWAADIGCRATSPLVRSPARHTERPTGIAVPDVSGRRPTRGDASGRPGRVGAQTWRDPRARALKDGLPKTPGRTSPRPYAKLGEECRIFLSGLRGREASVRA